MRKTILAIAFAFTVLPAAARAQVRASAGIQIDFPVVLPPLVVVSPGVQVVQDFDEEVFYTGGYYWVRRDGGWYRAPNHRARWVLVPPPAVPARLVKLPPGQYRRWKPAKAEKHHDHGGWGFDGRRDDDDRGHGNGHDEGHGNGKGNKHKR